MFLDVFAPDEAITILRDAAGEQRYAADPRAAQLIATLLGHLPLAIAVAAGRIRSLAWPLTEHLERLRTRPGRQVEDQVERAVQLSYADLTATPQRLFRLLALHPGQDVDGYAAAAMSGMDVPTIHTHLDTLLVANLIQRPQPDRYAFHDMIRAYSLGRAFDEDSSSSRREALTRLFEHYRRTASVAVGLAIPEQRPEESIVPAPFADADAATRWLDRELPNLLATALYAADGDWPDHTTQMSQILMRYLDDRGRIADAEALHTAAVRAAQSHSDRGAEGFALINLGILLLRQGRPREAVERFQAALPIAHETGDRQSLGRVLANLGAGFQMLGRFREALLHHERALSIAQEIGNQSAVARMLGNIGTVHYRLGRYAEALDRHEQALAIFRELGDRVSEGRELANLGTVAERLAGYPLALARFGQAKAIFDEIGYRLGTGYALAYLGVVHQRLGRLPTALDHHRQALALAVEFGDRELEAGTHNDMSETQARLGRVGEALDHCSAALELATRTGDAFEQGRAYAGLGDILAARGDHDQARERWRAALALFTELGVPEARTVETKLADSR